MPTLPPVFITFVSTTTQYLNIATPSPGKFLVLFSFFPSATPLSLFSHMFL